MVVGGLLVVVVRATRLRSRDRGAVVSVQEPSVTYRIHSHHVKISFLFSYHFPHVICLSEAAKCRLAPSADRPLWLILDFTALTRPFIASSHGCSSSLHSPLASPLLATNPARHSSYSSFRNSLSPRMASGVMLGYYGPEISVQSIYAGTTS